LSSVIRPATQDDLVPCLQLSGDCTTEHVWQVAQREVDDQITVTMNDVRLPRPMPVEYPRSPADIREIWNASDALLIAEQDGILGGYLDLHAERWHQTVWVKDLIVAELYRRHGIGTALIQAAIRWARAEKMRALMVEAQSQNGPAICFYRKQGFAFCGFNERYYANQIALFFARRIK